MTNNVEPFPNWKTGASAAERFSELEHEARKHPGRFAQVVVVFVERMADGRTLTRYLTSGCSTTEALGVLESGKMTCYELNHKGCI